MKFIYLILALGCFTACETPRFAYSPTAHNIPVFTQKNDSKLSGNFSTNLDMRTGGSEYDHNSSNGYDLQAAYAITDHFAVQGSYFKRKEKTHNSSSDNFYDNSTSRYNRNLTEFGAGYFTAIDTRKRVFFQVYGGTGFGKFVLNETGKADINSVLYTRFYKADLNKYYIEPSITFKSREVFAASLSTRFSIVKFKNIHSDFSSDEKQSFNLDSLDRNGVVFFEPSFVNSYGFNRLPGLRIEYQLGLSMLIGKEFFDYRRFNFSVGLMFDIPKLIRGPQRKNAAE